MLGCSFRGWYHAKDSFFPIDQVAGDGRAFCVSCADIDAGRAAESDHVVRSDDIARGQIVDLDAGIGIANKSIEFNPDQVPGDGMAAATFWMMSHPGCR